MNTRDFSEESFLIFSQIYVQSFIYMTKLKKIPKIKKNI